MNKSKDQLFYRVRLSETNESCQVVYIKPVRADLVLDKFNKKFESAPAQVRTLGIIRSIISSILPQFAYRSKTINEYD